MTKKFCRQCGGALTKAGAKFCTTCGATVDGVETDDVTFQETVGLSGEQTGQTVAATEVLPRPEPSSNYETEEMPRVGITAPAEERTTAVVADTPSTQSQAKPAEPAPLPSNGRKKLAMAAALGVVALAAVAFFFINSRRPSEAQAETQTVVAQAEPSGSPQPLAQQFDQQPNQQPGATNQAQPQTSPQLTGEVKSPAIHNAEAASKQQQAAAKPTPTTAQEKQPAGGTSSAEDYLRQGITHMNAGQYQEALREFEYVKKLDPGNKDVYYMIGSTYFKMNQLQQAVEAYRQCTSGVYAFTSQDAVKKLEKKVGKVNAR